MRQLHTFTWFSPTAFLHFVLQIWSQAFRRLMLASLVTYELSLVYIRVCLASCGSDEPVVVVWSPLLCSVHSPCCCCCCCCCTPACKCIALSVSFAVCVSVVWLLVLVVIMGVETRITRNKHDVHIRATPCTCMRRITTFRSTTDRISDGGPIII